MERLKIRADFVAVSRGRRMERPGFVLQAVARPEGSGTSTPRIGFTVTKRLGSAPLRNRIKRRLREAVRAVGPGHAAAGMDYVVVGRKAASTLPFDRLVTDLRDSLSRLSAGPINKAASAERRAQTGRADG